MKKNYVLLLLALFPMLLYGQINWYDQEIITADATVKEEHPNQNFNNESETDGCGRTWKRLYVRDTINASQETFLKVDISGLSAYITRQLRLRGTQNRENTHAYLIEVYGSRDVSWKESTITWDNSRNIALTDEPIAWYNLNLHSWNGKYVNFNDQGFYDFISAAITDGDESITLVLKSAEINSKNTAFFYSLEQPMAFWCSGGEDMWDQLPKPTIRTSASSFQQEADATVRESVPDGNYGKDNSLDVLMSAFGENRKSYLRFSLENITGFISGASLHFQGKQASGSQDPYYISVYSTPSNWNEDSITWNNAPAQGHTALASVNVNTNQKLWWEFSGSKLTEIINSALLLNRDSVSFVLASSSSAFSEVWFQSHELDDDCGIEFQFVPSVVDAPVLSPSSGSNFEDSVQITMVAEEADRIYYTKDGSEPTALDSLYSEPVWIKSNTSIKARAFKNGFPSKDYASETYEFSSIYVSPVVIEPAGGTYTDSVLVNFSGESNATLFFTTDGVEPDNNALVYTEPFWIYNDTDIKAIAYKNGFYSDQITSASFVIEKSVDISLQTSTTPVTIYPNPVTNNFFLIIDGNAHHLKAVVTNIHGKVLLTESAQNTNRMLISLDGIPLGIYTVSVYRNDEWYGNHIIIKN